MELRLLCLLRHLPAVCLQQNLMCQSAHCFSFKTPLRDNFCLRASHAVSVGALLGVHLLCIYVFFPTRRRISVNLAVELISQSGLRHVNLTEEGERTWHPLQRICRISALTKQSIHSHITFHLAQGVSSHCVLNRCACSDQFCRLDDC